MRWSYSLLGIVREAMRASEMISFTVSLGFRDLTGSCRTMATFCLR
jgi:hypothetical protein